MGSRKRVGKVAEALSLHGSGELHARGLDRDACRCAPVLAVSGVCCKHSTVPSPHVQWRLKDEWLAAGQAAAKAAAALAGSPGFDGAQAAGQHQQLEEDEGEAARRLAARAACWDPAAAVQVATGALAASPPGVAAAGDEDAAEGSAAAAQRAQYELRHV